MTICRFAVRNNSCQSCNDKYECTMDQELTSQTLGRLACSRRTLLCIGICRSERRADVADVMTAVLKVWRHIRNPTPSVDAHLLEEQFSKFHPDPVWYGGSLGFFEEGRPSKKKTMMMSSDMGSVPDRKAFYSMSLSRTYKLVHFIAARQHSLLCRAM